MEVSKNFREENNFECELSMDEIEEGD